MTNWYQIAAGDAYWNSSAAVPPLGQMWSLAVTEQMYLIGPLVIVALVALSRRRPMVLLGLFGLLFVATAAIGPLLFDGTNVDRVYMGSDARSMAFAAGAFTAAGVHQSGRRLLGSAAGAVASAVGIVALVALTTLSALVPDYRQEWIFRGGQIVVAVCAALLVGSLCVRRNLLAAVFAFRPLRFVGRISYLLFLVHLPVYWLIQTLTPGTSGWALFLWGGAVSLVVASVLHGAITEPLYRRKWRLPSAAVTGAIAVAAVVGTALFLPPLWTAPAEAAIASAQMRDLPPTASGRKPTVLLVGDSIGVSFSDALATYAEPQVTRKNLASGGCGLFDPEGARTVTGFTLDSVAIRNVCFSWSQSLGRAMKDNPDYVVIHSAWDAAEQLIGGKWLRPCDAEWQKRYDEKMGTLVALLRSAERPPIVLLANERLDAPFVGDANQVRCYNTAIAGTLRANPEFHLLDYNRFLLGDGTKATQETPDGDAMFTDGTHPGKEGQRYYAAWLLREMASAHGEASASSR